MKKGKIIKNLKKENQRLTDMLISEILENIRLKECLNKKEEVILNYHVVG